eukprot:3644428-Rhodomonas_salina.2
MQATANSVQCVLGGWLHMFDCAVQCDLSLSSPGSLLRSLRLSRPSLQPPALRSAPATPRVSGGTTSGGSLGVVESAGGFFGGQVGGVSRSGYPAIESHPQVWRPELTAGKLEEGASGGGCLLYTSPSPRDRG